METKQQSFEYCYSAPEQAEIKKIREKYMPKEERVTKLELLRKLDRDAEKPGQICSIVLGVIGTLLFGFGMCCTMVWTDWFVQGIAIGVVGMVILALAYPVYLSVTKKQRQKIAPRILQLTEELEMD